jgi:hypothetical protein
MLLTLMLLGVAHFLAYKKSRKGTATTNKAVLWVSTVMVVGMITYTLMNKGL